ncbi:MAG: hypothetical protein PUE00_10015 [Thermobifida fusca]|nr:hypothetical protein [Thermobifida fusca]
MTSSAEHTGGRAEPGAEATAGLDRRLMGMLAALNIVFLAALGLVGGIVAGLCAGWASWLWLTGTIGQLLSVATVLLFLLVLFSGARVIGWAVGAKWGPGAFAAGWILAGVLLTGYVAGGDVVMTSTVPTYLFLYGGVGAVIVATVLTPETRDKVTTDGGTSAPTRGTATPPQSD